MKKIMGFAKQHRVITGVILSALVTLILGHHELSWLLLAVNYDKILTAVLNS